MAQKMVKPAAFRLERDQEKFAAKFLVLKGEDIKE